MASSKKTSGFFSSIGSNIKAIPALLKDSKKRWRVIIPAIVVIAAVGGLIYYESFYLPSKKTASSQATLQTTVARRGDITLSASGTGTLQAAQTANLGFEGVGSSNSATLSKLNVIVGDKVKAGEVLAEIDDSTQQTALQQAQQALANLTSPAAIATAQQAVATDTTNVLNAKLTLMNLISPAVFTSELQVAADQQALDAAKAAGGSSPTADQQKAIDAAQAKLQTDQGILAGNQVWYVKNYVPNNFTVMQRNGNSVTKAIQAPTDAEIAAARAAYAAAQATLQEDQWYLDALQGQDIPANATGTNLTALLKAKSDLQTAQTNVGSAQIVAPFDGVVTAVNAQIGDTVGNSTIITIADESKLYLQTYVDESDYALFKVGNPVNVVFSALPNQTFTGKVVQVSPALYTSSGQSAVSGLVQLDPTNANLLIGMDATVTVIGGQAQNAVIIPISALHEYAPNQYAVFVDRSGQLSVTFVQVGLQDLVNAEIKSGLQPGEVVSTGLVGTKSQ
ncbi:MAG: efflux RND transporter periplasmic adaptor subunit [Chloroflexi bacterium]|nr:efflux RND transporter periplasmic adaptor subunit [Chloroflexota bacterium]